MMANRQNQNMISREEASRLVCDKETMYGALIRNGYVLPHHKQSICSLKFMQLVRSGDVWVPRKEQCNGYVKVATPPPRDKLAGFVDLAVERAACSGENTLE